METTCGGSSMNNFECPRCGHCCQALKTEQEPVAWLDAEMSQAYTIDELPDASGTGFLPLYTAPPKREWVGLTEKEWYAATGIPRNATLPMHMLKGIEKALKEKNG